MSDQIIDAPASLQPASLDKLMAQAHEKAMATDLQSFETSSSVPPSPPPTPTPAASPTETPAPSLSPAEAKVLDLPDDAVVKVKVDGEEQLLPVGEFKRGISREAHYTQRMQQLAAQRREAEEALAAQYAQIQQEAQAVQLAQQQLAAYLQQQQQPQAQPTPTQPDPGELATVGDVRATLQETLALLAQREQTREQQLMQAISQASVQVQEQAALQRDTQTFTKGLQTVLANPEYSLLTKVLPYAEESIRYQVASMDPQSIEEAITYSEQVAKEWSDRVRAEVLDGQKRQQVAQARAILEPPVSSPPSPGTTAPQSFMRKDGKLDWNALHARAASLMG